MARFPLIQRPCPLSAIERAGISGHCNLCGTSVTDLGAMTDAEREACLSATSGPACVSYRVRLPSIAAVGFAAALAVASPMPATAADLAPGQLPQPSSGANLIPGPVQSNDVCAGDKQICASDADAVPLDEQLEYIFVGGVDAGDAVRWFDAEQAPALASLQVAADGELSDWTVDGN